MRQSSMADAIHKLAAQYFQLVDPPNLDIPPGHVLVRPDVQTALYERMFDESLTPLPPTNYRARILKLLIARIEESIQDPEEDEILDDLMTCWANLVAQPKPSSLTAAQQLSDIKYTAPSDLNADTGSERTVITSESRGLILASGTTGFRTWEAALHLGSFLATPAGEVLVRGKRVIELGAGTGFLSLFCARHLGVRGVVSSDREIALIDNMKRCKSLNQLDQPGQAPFCPAVWEWGTPLEQTDEMDEFVEDGHINFDVALGADLIYDTDLVPLLLSTIKDLFENYSVQHFIIAATVRNEDTFKTFLEGCETNSFIVQRVPFESTHSEEQTGFFHATNIPIKTFQISRS